MNPSELDQEDIYKELPSLSNCHNDVLRKTLVDLPTLDQQQPLYESLPAADGDTHLSINETHQPPQITNINQTVVKAVLSLQEPVRCTRCKVLKTRADFGNRRNGERMKICRRCTLVRKVGMMMSLYRRERRHSIKS